MGALAEGGMAEVAVSTAAPEEVAASASEVVLAEAEIRVGEVDLEVGRTRRVRACKVSGRSKGVICTASRTNRHSARTWIHTRRQPCRPEQGSPNRAGACSAGQPTRMVGSRQLTRASSCW